MNFVVEHTFLAYLTRRNEVLLQREVAVYNRLVRLRNGTELVEGGASLGQLALQLIVPDIPHHHRQLQFQQNQLTDQNATGNAEQKEGGNMHDLQQEEHHQW
jgi:hypothetical protein